jgi:hypothetical protein
MGTKTFAACLTGAMVALMPVFALGWVFLFAVVNWHDVLVVVVALSVTWQLRQQRRAEYVTERAIRRVEASRIIRENIPGQRLTPEDAGPRMAA